MNDFRPFSENGSVSCGMKNVSLNSSLTISDEEMQARMVSFNNELYLLFRKHGIVSVMFEEHGAIGYFSGRESEEAEEQILFGVCNGEILHCEEEQPEKSKKGWLKRIK